MQYSTVSRRSTGQTDRQAKRNPQFASWREIEFLYIVVYGPVTGGLFTGRLFIGSQNICALLRAEVGLLAVLELGLML